jgi:hypothetical protein
MKPMMPVMRIAAAAGDEIRKFVPKVWRLARELFQEVTGFIFMALALLFTFGAGGLLHSFRQMDGGVDSVVRVAFVAGFVVMMGGFGVSCFLRARRISRDR